MTPIAIVMMIIAITVVWGGLAASIIFLRSRPEEDGGYADPDLVADDDARAAAPHTTRDL